MAIQIFTGNIIAVVWDFDQTLIPGYQQKPIFDHYNVDANHFWKEVEELATYYKKQKINVSPDTIYLNHILTYVKSGNFQGLNNKKLQEFGKQLEFYPGIPDFFEIANKHIENNKEFNKHSIKVEHYIVSTGLRQIIKGSIVSEFVEDVWACEFIEEPAQPGFDSKKEKNNKKADGEISQVGYFLDNTTKTRAIWEINKGTNKDPKVGVNDLIAEEDRRVPIRNMIYIADGPSDIPCFSIINKFGGITLGVYNPNQDKHFNEVKKLQDQGRVQHFSPADYSKGSDVCKWILKSLEEIAELIVKDRNRLLSEKVRESSKHITS
jgi:hypothetical protein